MRRLPLQQVQLAHCLALARRTLLLAGLALVAACSREAPPPPPSPPPTAEDGSARAQSWLDAAVHGDAPAALTAARRLVGPVPVGAVHPSYLELAEANGLVPVFFTDDFNEWDVRYWQYALFFQRLARDLTKDVDPAQPGALVEALFAAVRQRVQPEEPADGTVMWPYNVWQKGMGVCDRQSWLLAELAYQLGFETQIVYLRDPQDNSSPHTVCELRKGAGVWLADPLTGKLAPGHSAASLVAAPDALRAVWPDRPDWQLALGNAAYWLPAYPQDYCRRNQLLQERLVPLLGDRCPRFGEPPLDRAKAYLALTGPADRQFPYRFWFFPFRVLVEDMIKTARASQPAPVP